MAKLAKVKKAKTSRSPKRGSTLDIMQKQKMYGDAPKWQGIKTTDIDYETKYLNALNWANETFEMSDLKAWAIKYFDTKPGFEFVKDMPEFCFASVGKQCWLRLTNAPISEQSEKFFNINVEKLKQQYTRIQEEKVKEEQVQTELDSHEPKLTEKQQAKVEYANLFAILDNMILSQGISVESVYETIKNSAPSVQVLRMLEQHYKDNVADSQDNYKLKGILKTYNDKIRDGSASILAQVEKIAGNTKAENKLVKVRKPRKKKFKPVEKQVKNVKFKERDESLKLVSIPPTTVVGAQALVIFNTKTRKVGIFYANDATGLQVKGTTILNYDESKSKQKTLRKPLEILPHLTGSTVRRFEKVYEDVRAVSTTPKGRINGDILLLKVFK